MAEKQPDWQRRISARWRISMTVAGITLVVGMLGVGFLIGSDQEIVARLGTIEKWLLAILATCMPAVALVTMQYLKTERSLRAAEVSLGILDEFLEKRRAADSKGLALTAVYYERMESRFLRLIVLLSFAAMTVGIPVLAFAPLPDPASSLLLLLSSPFVVVAALAVKLLVTRFRVWKGLFGTNEYEARQLMTFIVENADSIDFTDGSGGTKKAFLPLETLEGESARLTGVTA